MQDGDDLKELPPPPSDHVGRDDVALEHAHRERCQAGDVSYC